MARSILTPIDMNKLEVRNMLAHVLASAPGSPVEGQLYYDSTNKTLEFRSNTAFISLGRLDQLEVPTAAVAFNGQKITGLADPTAAQDGATKAYVDATAIGARDFKDVVRVATAANITLAGGAPNIVDGVTLVAGDRILVKAQTAPAENGIYTVTTLGTGANGTWTRAADADASSEVTSGMQVPVSEGAVAADSLWMLSTNDPITLGTTGLSFSKLAPAAAGSVSRFTQLIGDGAATSIVVTHGIGQQFVIAQVFEVATLEQVECDIDMTSTTTTTFIFAVAPASNALRVVIVG